MKVFRPHQLCILSYFFLSLEILLGLASSFTFPSSQLVLDNHHRSASYLCSSAEEATDLSSKEELLSYLSELNSPGADARLPCGLECVDQEKNHVLALVAGCVDSYDNRAISSGGKIKAKDVVGEWDLLYTSSRTFSINRSLSGLGRSESESARFAGLRQKLSGSQYLGFIEFVEKLGSGEDGLDVVITGEWMFEPGMDSFSGAPVTAIRADLESVVYGPSKNKADDWSSLGPVKLLDIIYMDDDLYISRSKVKADTVFIYQRAK